MPINWAFDVKPTTPKPVTTSLKSANTTQNSGGSLPTTTRSIFTNNYKGQSTLPIKWQGKSLSPSSVPISPTMLPDTYYGMVNRLVEQNTPVSGTGGGGGGWGFSGGGGGGASAKPVKWSNMYSVPNAPTWWQGLVPSAYNAETSYLALINSMIPSMSAEDQQSTATYLATAFPDAFKAYNPGTVTNFTKAPDAITTELKQSFQSTDKANATLGALDKLLATMSAQTGAKKPAAEKKLGAGYTFLRSLVDTMKGYGGTSNTEQQTRRQYLNQASQLDPLLAMGKAGTLAPYAPIAQKIAQPYFTAGQLTPLTNGKFGTVNKQLFG